METLDDIKKQAEEIRDAKEAGVNTAKKVGGVLVGLAEHIGDSDSGTKKKKLKWRKVCRKSVRLGATVRNGNPVKYFGFQQTILLETGVRYRLYVNGNVCLVENIQTVANLYLNISSFKIEKYGDDSFKINIKNKTNIPLVIFDNFNALSPSFVYVDKVELVDGITNVYLVREILTAVISFDNGNKYFSVVDNRVEGRGVMEGILDGGEYKDGTKIGQHSRIEKFKKLRSQGGYNSLAGRRYIRITSSTNNSGTMIIVNKYKGVTLPKRRLRRIYRGGDKRELIVI